MAPKNMDMSRKDQFPNSGSLVRRFKNDDEPLLEEKYGIEIQENETSFLGWLLNMKETTIFNKTKSRNESALLLYFVRGDGSTIRTTYHYQPYFFVDIPQDNEGQQHMILNSLLMKFADRIAQASLTKRLDMSQASSLTGEPRNLIQIKFYSLEDMRQVKNELLNIVSSRGDRNAEIGLAAALDTNILEYTYNDPLQWIEKLYESDVPYLSRVCIDKQLYSAHWYHVNLDANGVVQLEKDPTLLKQPPLRIIAWDIETTKEKLRFPNADIDEVIMISYVYNNQGYLLVNRTYVSENIEEFDYYPKDDMGSSIIVYNVANEKDLLELFSKHIVSINPHIHCTYNGDFFDIPFIKRRCEILNISFEQSFGLQEIRKTDGNVYIGKFAIHIDCFCWVKRDSYLPQGSQGLKAVTKAKLKYNPVELDPELILPFAYEKPQLLASYSISDSIATFYLYKKYIHGFIFALCTILPLGGDDVLRKGSGTLCELLLMSEAYKAGVLFPDKQLNNEIEMYKNHPVEQSTYVGGRVESILSGIYRSDIKEKFVLDPATYQSLIDRVPVIVKFFIEKEMNENVANVKNFKQIVDEIKEKLYVLKNEPIIHDYPMILHVDVAAMYPNIILTNRLQPHAIVNDTYCTQCPYYYQHKENKCQKPMEWMWRGELFTANAADMTLLEKQLHREYVEVVDTAPVKEKAEKEDSESDEEAASDTEKKPYEAEKKVKRWSELNDRDKKAVMIKRLKTYSMKVYKKIKKTVLEKKKDVVCQRMNNFYIETVKAFRDRRYDYKTLVKKTKGAMENAKNVIEKQEKLALMELYDCLQLAHKCILNSFYGYVMRPGARWISMEMAGIVTHTGANIVKNARELIEKIGRVIELDTDGVWCFLPRSFPFDFTLELESGKKGRISFPCSMLNYLTHQNYTNHVYQTQDEEGWKTHSENSIFFEIDGPYLGMSVPASQEEGRLLKKRYAVYNFDGSIAELKGFELKRRGELKLIKTFQEQVFPAFGKVFPDAITGQESIEELTSQGEEKRHLRRDDVYSEVAGVANKWLDVLDTHGVGMNDDEIIEMLSESKTMSKGVSPNTKVKSMAITTALHLSEIMGESVLKSGGLTCHMIVTAKPEGDPVSARAIPVSVFRLPEDEKRFYLRKWLKDNTLVSTLVKDVLDWSYYKQRFHAAILKIISIPAELQGCMNPVSRVVLPDWLKKNKRSLTHFHSSQSQFLSVPQKNITHFFQKKSLTNTTGMNDLEDITAKGVSSAFAHTVDSVMPYIRNRKSLNIGFEEEIEVEDNVPREPIEEIVMEEEKPKSTLFYAIGIEAFVQKQKDKWKSIRKKISDRKNVQADKILSSPVGQYLKKLKQSYLHCLSTDLSIDKLLLGPLQVLSAKLNEDKLGSVKVWLAPINSSSVFQINVIVPRKIVVCSSSKLPIGDNVVLGTHLSLQSNISHVSVCHKELPQGMLSQSFISTSEQSLEANGAFCYAYELEFASESQFQDVKRRRAGPWSDQRIFNIFESEISLDYDLLSQLGHVWELRLKRLEETESWIENQGYIHMNAFMKCDNNNYSTLSNRKLIKMPSDDLISGTIYITSVGNLQRSSVLLVNNVKKEIVLFICSKNKNDKSSMYPHLKIFKDFASLLFPKKDNDKDAENGKNTEGTGEKTSNGANEDSEEAKDILEYLTLLRNKKDWTFDLRTGSEMEWLSSSLEGYFEDILKKNKENRLIVFGEYPSLLYPIFEGVSLLRNMEIPSTLRIKHNCEVLPSLEWVKQVLKYTANRISVLHSDWIQRYEISILSQYPLLNYSDDESIYPMTLDYMYLTSLRSNLQVHWASSSPYPDLGDNGKGLVASSQSASMNLSLQNSIIDSVQYIDPASISQIYGSSKNGESTESSLMPSTANVAELLHQSSHRPYVNWPSMNRSICCEILFTDQLVPLAIHYIKLLADKNKSLEFHTHLQKIQKSSTKKKAPALSSSTSATPAVSVSAQAKKAQIVSSMSCNESMNVGALLALKGVIDNIYKHQEGSNKNKKQSSASLLAYVYSWLANRKSLLYNDVLLKRINEATLDLWKFLLLRIRSFGCTPIYASYDKIIISTQKYAFNEGVNFSLELASSLNTSSAQGNAEISFNRLGSKVGKIYATLLWYDHGNYAGVEIDREHLRLILPLFIKFRYAEVLSNTVRTSFYALLAEFILKPLRFLSVVQKETITHILMNPTMNANPNGLSNSAYYTSISSLALLEQLKEFLNEGFMSNYLIKVLNTAKSLEEGYKKDQSTISIKKAQLQRYSYQHMVPPMANSRRTTGVMDYPTAVDTQEWEEEEEEEDDDYLDSNAESLDELQEDLIDENEDEQSNAESVEDLDMTQEKENNRSDEDDDEDMQEEKTENRKKKKFTMPESDDEKRNEKSITSTLKKKRKYKGKEKIEKDIQKLEKKWKEKQLAGIDPVTYRHSLQHQATTHISESMIRLLLRLYSLDTLMQESLPSIMNSVSSVVGFSLFSFDWQYPVQSFLLRNICCLHCGYVDDLDLTLSHDLYMSHASKTWTCTSCKKFLPSSVIEMALIQQLEMIMHMWYCQDLVCSQCHTCVSKSSTLPYCYSCNGVLRYRIDVRLLKRYLRIVSNMAQQFDLKLCQELLMQWKIAN